MPVAMCREGKPCALPMELQTGIATTETGWKMVKKLKPELPYDPAIPLPRIYPKEVKANWKRHPHPHVQGSIIYNSQVMETTPVSTS